MGGDYFVECTQKTSRQVLKEAGVGDKLIDELATAVDRSNYGQSADMVNGLTGISNKNGHVYNCLQKWFVVILLKLLNVDFHEEK